MTRVARKPGARSGLQKLVFYTMLEGAAFVALIALWYFTGDVLWLYVMIAVAVIAMPVIAFAVIKMAKEAGDG